MNAFRTHQLAKVAEVHNAEMKDLEKRLSQAKKDLQVWEHDVKFDFPSTPRQLEAQMEADSPHASQVAKYLVATDDATRKFITEYAKQAGRVWSEERIQRMLEHYNGNVSSSGRPTIRGELIRGAPRNRPTFSSESKKLPNLPHHHRVPSAHPTTAACQFHR